ncbi:MAG: GNAT family N-acetyltransferase [Deltaproteobacteria bacterium]|nr:GNAT family N-acetyltransferase [Deltaproteobacteria bacterium]
MDLTVTACRPGNLERLLDLFDAEFVRGRGRTVPLRRRFPHILRPEALDTLFTASSGDVLCGGAAVRKFVWKAGGRLWQGAMVGMVCTAPQFRGRGVGSALLRGLTVKLSKGSVDFAVLWTSKHRFYERLGWKAHLDLGQLGRIDFTEKPPAQPPLIPRGFGEVDLDRIESCRSQHCSSLVLRTALDYRALPFPADSVEFFFWDRAPKAVGYAIVGRQGSTGYLYELVSRTEDFHVFLSSFASAYTTLFVNEHSSGLFYNWLRNRPLGTWDHQDQTLWFLLSREMSTVDLSAWHIPYIDRM